MQAGTQNHPFMFPWSIVNQRCGDQKQTSRILIRGRFRVLLINSEFWSALINVVQLSMISSDQHLIVPLMDYSRVPTIARTELAAPCGHFVKTDFLLIWKCRMKWFLFLFEWEEGRIPGIWKQLLKLVHMCIHVMYLGPWAVKCTSICPNVQFSYQLPQRQAYILYRLDFPIVFFLNHHLALADPSFLLPKCPQWTVQIPTTLPKYPPPCSPVFLGARPGLHLNQTNRQLEQNK